MKTHRKKKWIILAVCVVLLPFVYLLAAGPFIYLAVRGAMSKEVVEVAGFPITFGYDHGVFEKLHIKKPLSEYYVWWADKGEAARKRAEKIKPRARPGSPVPNTTK
jgi:hypothetical protein